jgi:hypothetical protein
MAFKMKGSPYKQTVQGIPEKTLTEKEKRAKGDYNWNEPRGGKQHFELKRKNNPNYKPTEYEERMVQRDKDKKVIASYEKKVLAGDEESAKVLADAARKPKTKKS